MKNICEKCGGKGVVYVDALANPKEAKPKRTTLSMIAMELENDLMKLRSRFVRAITKVFSTLRR